MGRRASRRMWHALAAILPLPLMGMTYVVASGGQSATNVVLFLTPPGDVSTVVRRAAITPRPIEISTEARELFYTGRKGPRADRYVLAEAVPGAAETAGTQRVAASLTGGVGLAKAVSGLGGNAKGKRLETATTEVALRVPERRGPQNSLFMNASFSSPFNEDFQVDAFRPTNEDLAYTPDPEALDFRYRGETQAEFEERERRCLAVAIYFEARGEPERGQIAVGQVILNRVRSPRFPETICGVVYQGQMRKGCQFSFTCDGHTDNPRKNAQWTQAQELSREIMSGEHWLPEVGYSAFYHANYVWPRWARSMNKIDKIGRHIFYKNRNQQPYVVEASADTEDKTEANSNDGSGYMLPTLSLASAVESVNAATDSAVNSVSGSVTAVAGASPSVPTQAMSLGYAASE